MKVIVPSCYAYRACWQPWMYFFRKHWIENPPAPILLTDRHDDKDVDGFAVYERPDRGFCRNLRSFLEGISDEWLFVVLEDHWICDMVDDIGVDAAQEVAETFGVGVLRLHPSPGPTDENAKLLGTCEPGTRYRISTAPSLWNRKYLMRLLESIINFTVGCRNPGSAWDFEIAGSELSSMQPELVVSTVKPVIPFWNSAIVRGKWHPDVVKNARAAGAVIDTSGMEFMS